MVGRMKNTFLFILTVLVVALMLSGCYYSPYYSPYYYPIGADTDITGEL